MILVALLLYLVWSVALEWRHLFICDGGVARDVEEDGARLAKVAKDGDGDAKLARGLDEVINAVCCRCCLVGDVETLLQAKKRRLQAAKEVLEKECGALEWIDWLVGGDESLSEERRGLDEGITRVGRAIKGVEEEEREIERVDLRVEIRGAGGKCYYSFESKGRKVVEVGEKKEKTTLLKGVKDCLGRWYESLAVPLQRPGLNPAADEETIRRALQGDSVDATHNDNRRVQDTQEGTMVTNEKVQANEASDPDMERIDEVQKQLIEAEERLREQEKEPQEAKKLRDMMDGMATATATATEKVEAKGSHQPNTELVNEIEDMVEEYTDYLRENGKRLPESEKIRQGSNEGAQSASSESEWDMLAPEAEGWRPT